MKKCLFCNTAISRFNPYKICHLHQEKALSEKVPFLLREELERLKTKRFSPSDGIYTKDERGQIIDILSYFLQTHSSEEIKELLRASEPEEIHEKLLQEDELRAEGFAQAVIFLRGEQSEMLQEFIKEEAGQKN